MGSLGRVLVVCTANVCRSPLAQRVLQARLAAAGLPVEVGSAGLRAMRGAPMCDVSAEELPSGAEAQHVARQVDGAAVAGADLVLAMEREQRGALVRSAPGSQAKVFTLREAAALAAALADRGEALPDAAAVARGLHGLRGLVAVPAREAPKRRWYRRAEQPEDPLTIVDGHGGPDAQHRAATADVRRHAEALADALIAVLQAPGADGGADRTGADGRGRDRPGEDQAGGSSPERSSAAHSSDASSVSPATDGWK